MKKIDKSVKDQLVYGSVDYCYKNNDSNMRCRWVFYVKGAFICIENNTNGWFEDTTIQDFSSSVSWLNRC